MNTIIKKTALKFGLIGFFIFVISYFALWQIDLSLFLNPLVTYPIAIAVFILAVYAQKQAKTELGGYISFGSALLYFVITVAITYLGYVVAALLIFNIIDPEAKEKLLELTIQASIEMSNSMLSWFGLEEAAGQVSEEQIRSSMALSPTPMGIPSIIIGYISNVAFYTVLGLISSLIIKKDQPYEFE